MIHELLECRSAPPTYADLSDATWRTPPEARSAMPTSDSTSRHLARRLPTPEKEPVAAGGAARSE